MALVVYTWNKGVKVGFVLHMRTNQAKSSSNTLLIMISNRGQVDIYDKNMMQAYSRTCEGPILSFSHTPCQHRCHCQRAKTLDNWQLKTRQDKEWKITEHKRKRGWRNMHKLPKITDNLSFINFNKNLMSLAVVVHKRMTLEMVLRICGE